MTGNGQGNVTNTDMSAQHYFGSGRETVAAVLKQYDEKWLVGELTSLGGLFAADGAGRVYPASRQASAVTDLFRFALAEREVAVRTGERGVRVRRADSGFAVQTASAEYRARALVLAAAAKRLPTSAQRGTAMRSPKVSDTRSRSCGLPSCS